jgi:hypothetical protein
MQCSRDNQRMRGHMRLRKLLAVAMMLVVVPTASVAVSATANAAETAEVTDPIEGAENFEASAVKCYSWTFDDQWGNRRPLLVVASGKYTRARPYASATKIILMHYGELRWSDYYCYNSYGNLWYHIVAGYDSGPALGYGYSRFFVFYYT